jgi:hypothetical protein
VALVAQAPPLVRQVARVAVGVLAHPVLLVAQERLAKEMPVVQVLLVPILEQAAAAVQGQLALLVQEARLALEV